MVPGPVQIVVPRIALCTDVMAVEVVVITLARSIIIVAREHIVTMEVVRLEVARARVHGVVMVVVRVNVLFTIVMAVGVVLAARRRRTVLPIRYVVVEVV